MSKYTITRLRIYEVDADSEQEAIDKVYNDAVDIKEIVGVGQGSYDCDIGWDPLALGLRGHEEEYNRFKTNRKMK